MNFKTLAWIYITFIWSSAAAQKIEPPDEALAILDSLEKKANAYSENHPIEKVYVHFDKPFYVLGETIWYKGYVVNGLDLDVSNISSVLNLDWIDPSGKLVLHQRLKIEIGGAIGSFVIDTALREGTYRVRAYTNWMRNESQDLFFWKKIQVFDPRLKHPELPVKNEQSKIDLQFFPEGGTMITGILTQIAFKAIDMNGRAIDVQGQIVDEENTVITHFQSVHNGMGVIPITANASKSYRAILPTGEIYPLPPSSLKGLALTVSNLNENKIYVSVQSTEQYQPAGVYMVGQSRGAVCYAAYIKMDSTLKNISISKNEVPEGVLQLTLFDSDGIPQNERMLFIKKDDSIDVSVKSNKERYALRDSIILNFEIGASIANPAETSLSVSVTDASFIKGDNNSENIYTRLLLQSDIKGNVESPGWYFETQSLEKMYALDLVMRTHGWSRYNWEKILSIDDEPPAFMPENGITLEGRILTNNKPVANAVFMLMIPQPGNNNNVGVYETDSLGHFTIPGLDFNDSTLLSFRIMNRKGVIQNAKVELTASRDIPPVIHYNNIPTTVESNDNLSQRPADLRVWGTDKYKVLEEIVVKSRTNKIRTVGMGAKLVKPDAVDLKARLATSQFVSRYAMKLPFYGSTILPDGTEVWNGARILINGLEADMTGPAGNPYFILNSVPIEDIEHVIVDGKPRGGYFIAITTKKSSSQEATGTTRQMVKGFDAAREFYHPKYGRSDPTSALPDNRVTLYWNPNLQFDKDGKATVKLYNTDTTKKILITAEGIVNGHPVSTSQVVGKVD